MVVLIVSRHWRPAEWVLAQVTSAWLEGAYGKWLSVILDTIGDGCQSSGPAMTVGAMGIFSPPLKGTIEYYISSGEQIICGYFQEFWASEQCFECNNCSLAAPSLEVTSQVNPLLWNQYDIRDEVNSTHIDSDKLITQPSSSLSSHLNCGHWSVTKNAIFKLRLVKSTLNPQHGISKVQFLCFRTMRICQRYDLIRWSLSSSICLGFLVLAGIFQQRLATFEAVFVDSIIVMHNYAQPISQDIKLTQTLHLGQRHIHCGNCDASNTRLQLFRPAAGRQQQHAQLEIQGMKQQHCSFYAPCEFATQQVEKQVFVLRYLFCC